MSMLIIGENPPKSCYVCSWYNKVQCPVDDGKCYYKTQRHPSCPLVEIPTPHGRLIDADKLLEKAYWDYNEATHDYNNFRVVSEYDIADAPTVIKENK